MLSTAPPTHAFKEPSSASTNPTDSNTQAPTITYKPLHPTFGAEVSGVDFANVTPAVVEEIKAGLAQYGVLVFRGTGLDDARHVAMSHLFGDLDDVAPYVAGLGQVNRLSSDYLFDVSNLNPDGTISIPTEMRALLLRCNLQFHADSAFNPRRAGISLLLAHELPPPGTGGDTEFADTRTAYADLLPETKERIGEYVVMNSQLQCRRSANPGNPKLAGPEFEPLNHRFGKHRLVQTHEPSGRTNLYIAAHAHHIEGKPVDEGRAELDQLLNFVAQDKYTLLINWNSPGDLLVWDNTCVLHRSCGGSYEGKYKRDLRRTTVHDMSSQAWGLNEVGETWRSGLP